MRNHFSSIISAAKPESGFKTPAQASRLNARLFLLILTTKTYPKNSRSRPIAPLKRDYMSDLKNIVCIKA
jgi:hypothetical protein